MQIFRNLKVAIAALIIVAGMVGISFASASGPESTMVYFGCLHNGSLSSVQIGTPPKCPKGFRLINWNATGPQGDAGTPGSTGPAGASSNYPSISTSSYSIGFGTGAITIATGLAWTTGQTVLIAADQSHYVIATVVSYDSATGVMNFSVGNTPGSVVGGGTFTNWTVNLDGPVGQAGYSGSDGKPGDSTVYKRTNNDIVLSTLISSAAVASTQNYFIVAVSNQVEKISYTTGQVMGSPLTISTGSYTNGNGTSPNPINSISVTGNTLWAAATDSIYEISISNWAVIGSPISAPINPIHSGTCEEFVPIASDMNGAYSDWLCQGSASDVVIFQAISNSGTVVFSHTFPSIAGGVSGSLVTGTNNNVWLELMSVSGCGTSGFGCIGTPSLINLNSLTLALTTVNTGSDWNLNLDSNEGMPTLFVIGSNVFISKFDVWNEYDQTGNFVKSIGLIMGQPQCSIGNIEYFLAPASSVTAVNTSNNEAHVQSLLQGGGQFISTPNGALWLLDWSGSLEQLVPVSF